MGILIAVGQLILSLSILIVLHEGGHFFPSKWFGVKVEKFYLFFDAGIKSLGFEGSLFKHKIGETEYGIGWLPLGGYVKIAGMMDESFDKEQLDKPAEDWEFRSKPAWQRLIIMIGGVTVNFILGIFLLSMVLFTWGKQYLPAENATMGIAVDSLGMELGLQDGDIITMVGDKPLEKFGQGGLVQGIAIDGAKTVTVKRNGTSVVLQTPADYGKRLVSETKKGNDVFALRQPFVIESVPKGKDSPANKAGIMPGDSVILINDQPAAYYSDFVRTIRKDKNKEIKLGVIRGNQKVDLKVTPNEKGLIGVVRHPTDRYFEFKRITYGLGEAFKQGTQDSYDFLATQVKAFGKIFSGEIAAKDSLGGFISIGGLFGEEWIWERFWQMTGILSLILGFMNLLPIPILDGGHVVFLLYEMVTGRTVPERVMEVMMYAGLILIGALMIFANGNDIWGLIKDWF